MSGVIDGLLADVDSILGIRDDIGAAKKAVAIVTRTWSGSEPGDGTYSDSVAEMVPTPRVVEFTDLYRIREGGAVKEGDIMLKMISKQTYPERKDVDCSVNSQKVEKFYRVGDQLYRVIKVEEKHVVWSVQLRRVAS